MSEGFRRVHLAALLGVLLVPAATMPAGAEDGPLGQTGDWERVFTDEFNGPALDAEKWTLCYWWDNNGCTNLGTGEREWYMPANTSVEDGHLKLTARKESVIGHEGREFDFTSGMVTTGRYYVERYRPARFATRRGYVEIRAKVPFGQGLWPAFWLLPTDHESRPEIDVMEILGHRPGTLEMHFHFLDAEGKRKSAGSETEHPDLSKDWHVYGLEWSEDAIVWYLDGVEQWRYAERNYIPDEPMYLLINLAVGGEWPGDPDDSTIFPAHFLVDYVRAWRRLES
jgi:beta-glucanase (GH16 family)